MVDGDQARPLTPAGSLRSDDAFGLNFDATKIHKRRCIKCCGCIAAIMLIIAVVIIILAFTVFQVKEPSIHLNNVTVTQLELINGTLPKPGVNMSLIADVSVKNPNFASFKYTNTTTTLYYHGVTVGEARGPPGRSRARRTMRMNITVDIIPERIMSSPNLTSDIGSGVLPMSSYSRIPGRVKLINIIKKHVIVKMNCTMVVNITSRAIQEQKCKRHVNLNF